MGPRRAATADRAIGPPLRSVAADVSRLKLHSRPAKKRPFEVIRLTPDATAGYGPSRSRHRRPRHPSAPIDQYVLGGKFTRAFALDLLLPRAILVSLGCGTGLFNV